MKAFLNFCCGIIIGIAASFVFHSMFLYFTVVVPCALMLFGTINYIVPEKNKED